MKSKTPRGRGPAGAGLAPLEFYLRLIATVVGQVLLTNALMIWSPQLLPVGIRFPALLQPRLTSREALTKKSN